MYYEIYVDVVFLMNFILDFIVVRLTGSITKRKSTLFRCVLAAILSSFALCVLYVYDAERLLKYYSGMMFIMNTATVFIVFYNRKTKIYEVFSLLMIYYTISFVLGGFINLICRNSSFGYYLFTVRWWKVCLAGCISLVAVRPLIMYIEKCKAGKSMHYEVEILIGDRGVGATALLDTGNRLWEPVSGKPVHVAELSLVAELLKEDFVAAVRQYYENGMADSRLYNAQEIRMVPFRAVGTPEGRLLVAVRADALKVKNKAAEYEEKNVYIGLYTGCLSGDGSYRMLLHSKELMRERG